MFIMIWNITVHETKSFDNIEIGDYNDNIHELRVWQVYFGQALITY